MRQILRRYSEPPAVSGAVELKQADDLRHIRPGSSLWAVGRTDKLWNQGGAGPRFGAWELSRNLFQGSKTVYVSAQSTSLRLQFQVENYCDSPASAERITNFLRAALGILRARPASALLQKQDNIAALLADLSVRQVGESVFVEWQWDEEVWRWLRGQPK